MTIKSYDPKCRSIIFALLLFAVVFLFPVKTFGYTITGQIVNATRQTPIPKAVVIGRNAAKKVKVGVETDSMGRFSSIDVKDSTLTLEIAKDSFATATMIVNGTSETLVDLGIIKLRPMAVSLEEVTVTAQSVVQKADRYIIIPSQKDLKQATNGMSLLNNLQFKMPGLLVNESLQSITVGNTSPILKINGKTTDLTHILSVNPDHVLRIEYFDNPDIRYENRQVINIILKQRDDGGYVICNLFSALTTRNINANVGASYHYKRSEFDLNYSTGWRDYNKRSRSSEETFVGGGETINRYADGVPGDFHYLSNVLSIGYTYMHDINTVMSLNAGVAFENQNFDDNSLNTEFISSNIKTYHRLIGRTIDYTSPNFDLYFKRQIDKSQFFEVNTFGSYSRGNFGRNSSDTYDDMLMTESINAITQNTA